MPDALRMAPGIQVARVDAHTGLSLLADSTDRFANKLLVQIGGRVVYNASF